MTEAEPRPQLSNLVNKNTSPKQFEEAISQILSEQDKAVIGEDATAKTVNGLLYISAMAPFPATFDKKAFISLSGVTDEGEQLKDEAIDKIFEISLESGVIQEHNGRFSISKATKETLNSILEKYE